MPTLRRAGALALGAILLTALLAGCGDDDDSGGGGGSADVDLEELSSQCEELATTVEDPLAYLLDDIAGLEEATAGASVSPDQFEAMRDRVSELSEKDQRYVSWATCMVNLGPPVRFACGPVNPEATYLVELNEQCKPIYPPSLTDEVVTNPMPHGEIPVPPATTETTVPVTSADQGTSTTAGA